MVKKIEPAKKTTASAPTPTSSTNPGNGPMKKQSEPTAKPTAIARSQATRVAGRGPIASAWPIMAIPRAPAHGMEAQGENASPAADDLGLSDTEGRWS